MPTLDTVVLVVEVYALVVSVIGVVLSTRKLNRFWRTRHLRKVWGIRDRDHVVVVCSELDEPEKRQNVEPREFIYNLKYGDVDAYFEVVITLLRLYPKLRLHVLSAGEAETTRIDLARHLVLIGGPDYNTVTARILEQQATRYTYKSPYWKEESQLHPGEIVLYDRLDSKEYCEVVDDKDYGYFERIRNPNNPEKNIILIGGCHTIGVTGAVRAFSMAESEEGEIPKIVLQNAKIVARRIYRNGQFSVLVPARRVGQTINVPVVSRRDVRKTVTQTPKRWWRIGMRRSNQAVGEESQPVFPHGNDA